VPALTLAAMIEVSRLRDEKEALLAAWRKEHFEAEPLVDQALAYDEERPEHIPRRMFFHLKGAKPRAAGLASVLHRKGVPTSA